MLFFTLIQLFDGPEAIGQIDAFDVEKHRAGLLGDEAHRLQFVLGVSCWYRNRRLFGV